MASTINRVAHGLVAGQRVVFSSIVPSSGTGLDPNTVYYVISAGLTANAFEISETAEGTPLTLLLAVTSANMAVVPETTATSPSQAITATASTDLINATAHGFIAGDTVYFTALVGGTGLVESTTYYVLASGLTANAFKVAHTAGGAIVDITVDYSAGLLWRTAAYTAITDATDVMAPPTTPAAPAAPTVTSAVVSGVVRMTIALNTTPEVKARLFEVQVTHKYSGATPDWTAAQVFDLTEGSTGMTMPAIGSTKYAVRALLADVYGNFSPLSTVTEHTTLAGADSLSLINGPATVTIDATGITVLNGSLILQDEFGKTVMVSSGFSGSWSDFVMLGLYNGRLISGVPGVVPNGRTVALPYWTISDPDAAAETLTYSATSPPGAKMTWGAINKRKRMTSDLVAISPNSYYEFGVTAELGATAGQVQVDLTVLWFLSDGVTPSFTPSAIVAQAQMLLFGAETPVAGSTQAPFDAAFCKVQIDGQEQTTHNSTNYITIRQAWASQTPTHLGLINAIQVQSAGEVIAGSLATNSAGAVDPELSTAGNATIGGKATASGGLAVTGVRPGMVALPFVFTGTVTGTGDTTMFTSDAGVAMGSTRERYDVPWAGRIVGISLRDSSSRTAGTLIGKATINGAAASPPTATVDGTHVDHRSAVTTYALGATFSADDGIGMIATGSAFTPTTNNLVGVVYVVFDAVG